MPLPPEDWPRVGDVFEGARALPADKRPAYLAERCGGDDALRQEVESLLAWDDARAESFLDSPVLVRVDDAIVTEESRGSTHRSVSVGVEDRRRRDGRGLQSARHATRSHRGDQGPDRAPRRRPPRRERFQREARAVAALNHPHICTLHDVGSHDRTAIDFLVMEYLDGETLAERLAKGPLPLDRALQYAIQIAERARQGAPSGDHASRLEAGQRHAHTVGDEAARLRAGEAATGGRGVVGMSAAADTPARR